MLGCVRSPMSCHYHAARRDPGPGVAQWGPRARRRVRALHGFNPRTSPSGKAAQPQAAPPGQEGCGSAAAAASPASTASDKIEQVDYKDDELAAAVRLRAGQDPLAPDHRRLPSPSGPDRPRRQARARAGAAAVRERGRARATAAAAGAAGTATGTGSDAMPEAILLQDVETLGERARRRRLQGLPAQLPDPAQARAARDEGRAGGRRGPQRQDAAERAARNAVEQGRARTPSYSTARC